MATSRLTALRDALAAGITAQLATDGTTGVTVTAYPPIGDWTREDRVWLGNIEGTQEPLTQGASGKRLENLTVALTVFAPTFGGSAEEQETGEDRAELIFASVENAVRGDITVSGTVFNIELDSFESKPGTMDADGPIGMIEANLIAEAHL